MWESQRETVSKTRDDSRDQKNINILIVSRATIFRKEKENCAANENISQQPISFFRLHVKCSKANTNAVLKNTQFTTKKNQPCVTVCCKN